MRAAIIVVFVLIATAAFCGLNSAVNVETYSYQTGTTTGDSTPVDRYLHDVGTVFADGSGDNQCDIVYRAEFTIGAGASVTYDLYSGLTDAFGNALVFATLKAAYVYNDSASQTLTIGSGTIPLMPWCDIATGTVQVRSNGAILYLAPYDGLTISSSTARNIHVENNAGASCTGRIFLLGVSE